MKIVGLEKWSGSYAEIGQTNPLRWQNLRPIGNGVFEAVSKQWKCKDFMNEVVTSFHTGRDFSIYGFTVEHNKFFAEGQQRLPILLHNVKAGWKDNMEVVNDYLLEQGFEDVYTEVLPNNQALINIPPIYLTNTMFMSQVTLFIRLANTETVYGSINEMCNDKLNKQDANNLAACFKKPLKDFPKELEQYIWYYNDEQNLKHGADKSATINTSLMHNCGVVSWGWKEELCAI